MKIEVGMYVRNDYGLIGKVIEKYKGVQNAIIYKIDVPSDDFDYTNVFKFEIIKSSNIIIDLIEVGDYVNGYKVRAVYLEGIRKYFKLDCNPHERWYEDDIKTIVTKEQFERISYKVEGNNV